MNSCHVILSPIYILIKNLYDLNKNIGSEEVNDINDYKHFLPGNDVIEVVTMLVPSLPPL